MIIQLYSVYDKVAAIFHKPFSEINDATAIRAFENSLKENPDTVDFELYSVGEFDDSNGEITMHQSTTRIRTGFDIAAAWPTDPEILKKQA